MSAAADASTAAKFKYPVPWTVTADKLYLFAINTPAAAPTHAPSYVGRPAWALEQPGSGRGFILVAKYSDSPAGPYSELIYLPGRFKPSSAGGVCSSAPFWSVQRIWVDSQMALMAGRSVWGYPKVRPHACIGLSMQRVHRRPEPADTTRALPAGRP